MHSLNCFRLELTLHKLQTPNYKLMNNELVTLHLPPSLYERLQILAAEERTDPIGAISQLLRKADKQKAWLQDLSALCQQVQAEGGPQPDCTKAEMIAQLRQTRQEIFEMEYEHLY